jgi:hypothetical protein
MSPDTSQSGVANERGAIEQIVRSDQLSATDAAVEYFKLYSRERPEVVALWAFGIGFVLGWKLKLW